jgi:hypothetical protein
MKYLTGTNTLAYFGNRPILKKQVMIKMTAGLSSPLHFSNDDGQISSRFLLKVIIIIK